MAWLGAVLFVPALLLAVGAAVILGWRDRRADRAADAVSEPQH
jgi:hypothetical protein